MFLLQFAGLTAEVTDYLFHWGGYSLST